MPSLPHRLWRPRVLLAVCLSAYLSACALPERPAPVVTARSTTSPGLIIIQTDASPAFADVTRVLAKKWRGEVEVHQLSDAADGGAALRKQVQASEKDLVVAVGLPAARLARHLRGKKIVFCQVFHYEQAGLITGWMKGVSPLPPAARQFDVWQRTEPGLSRVGLITGKGLRNMLAEADAAARKRGITLIHVEVRSDLELLYAYKRLSPEIDGLWLLPDNRVLSRHVLHELLSLSERQNKPVLAFGSAFIGLPGVTSITSDPMDIADQVIARLAAAAAGNRVPGADVTPLTRLLRKTEGVARTGSSATSERARAL